MNLNGLVERVRASEMSLAFLVKKKGLLALSKRKRVRNRQFKVGMALDRERAVALL